MSEQDPKPDEKKQPDPELVECPMCKHKFLHKIKAELKDAGQVLGDALGETLMDNR